MKLTKLVNLIGILSILNFASCGLMGSSETSGTTGWEYNNPENGGFENVADLEQPTGPGLVLIEGGAFTMGQVEQDVMYEWNNMPRTVTLSSFYMDMYEVSNLDYREYLYWIRRVFVSYPQVYDDAVPDTLVWRRRLAYNEPYVEYYFRHPGYDMYPVVGVSWKKAEAYCNWRTDRVNEQLLIDAGFLLENPSQVDDDNFNTEAYLAGQYEGLFKERKKDLDPNKDDRNIRMEDGVLVPRYRLPTEAEWEFAAISLIGETTEERVYSRRLYPWSGHFLRNDKEDHLGKMQANFQRGRGDMMGVAGALNDNAAITARIDAYWPNDYGLYCMAGNVNEWVQDVYRPLSFTDFEEFRPFRGNIFKTKVRDEEGNVADKDSLGRVQYIEITEQEAMNRYNYDRADNRNYKDGDVRSTIDAGDGWNVSNEAKGSNRMYKQDKTSLIDDESRVFKGGGWRDMAYWLVPGTRRYLAEDLARDDLGFRCAMTRIGSNGGH